MPKLMHKEGKRLCLQRMLSSNRCGFGVDGGCVVTVFWLGPGLVRQGGARLNSSLTWVGGGGGPGQCARGTRGPVHDCLQNVQNKFGDSSAFVSLRPTPHITRTRSQ